MKFCLINPNWSFEGSIYFGCRNPHLPVEFGYSKALLEASGHEAVLIDAHMEGLNETELALRTSSFAPDIIVITTAPSYLFWRCAQPELRVPHNTLSSLRAALSGAAGRCAVIAVGPHASATPGTTLSKLAADAVIRGEFEEVLGLLQTPFAADWNDIPSLCTREGGMLNGTGVPHVSAVSKFPAIEWPNETIQKHRHHHHRFDNEEKGFGAEIESSRGCPYHCSFCAREYFRGPYRRRPDAVVLREMDSMIAQGARYFYFIDEIFLPDRELLDSVAERRVNFGIQTRIELWDEDMLDLLGGAGCVSLEAGVESITEDGRREMNKQSVISVDRIAEKLIHAKKTIAFVQATLMDNKSDMPSEVEKWRKNLLDRGVWANKPVPLFPYPGSFEYRKRWGEPDETAWERAHAFYLRENRELSDIQDNSRVSLEELESELIHGK